jgi:hypothetical protein
MESGCNPAPTNMWISDQRVTSDDGSAATATAASKKNPTQKAYKLFVSGSFL